MTLVLTLCLLLLAFLLYLSYRWWHPIDALIEQLYGRSDKPARHANKKIQHLERAIRFALKRQRHHDTHGALELSQELDELLMKLQADQQDLITRQQAQNEFQHSLEAKNKLLTDTGWLIETGLVEFISALNSGATVEVLNRLANDIGFLISIDKVQPEQDSAELISLIDKVLMLAAPTLRERQLRVHCQLVDDCPGRLLLAATSLQQALLRLLLDQGAMTQANNVALQLSFDNNLLELVLDGDHPITLTADLNDYLRQRGATWRDDRLLFPAMSVIEPIGRMVETGITALVITESDIERQAIIWRLKLLGVECTTQFKSRKIDLCLITDESSEVFLSIKPLLDDTTHIALINSRYAINRTFWTTLPEPVTQQNLANLVHHIMLSRDDSRDLHCLIVDDSETNARMLARQITQLGHTYDMASSGPEAFEKAASMDYQIIFMDIQMPGMNGIETTQRVRQVDHQTPIFGLTAHASLDEKAKYRDTGMNDVLIKPVRKDRLRSIFATLQHLPSRPPLAVPASTSNDIFNRDLALRNAENRPELAQELLSLLMISLQDDQAAIMSSTGDKHELGQAVHKLHGAVRFCGVPRLENALSKLASAIKAEDDNEIGILLNYLDGEITALTEWYRTNPDPFSSTAVTSRRQ